MLRFLGGIEGIGVIGCEEEQAVEDRTRRAVSNEPIPPSTPASTIPFPSLKNPPTLNPATTSTATLPPLLTTASHRKPSRSSPHSERIPPSSTCTLADQLLLLSDERILRPGVKRAVRFGPLEGSWRGGARGSSGG